MHQVQIAEDGVPDTYWHRYGETSEQADPAVASVDDCPLEEMNFQEMLMLLRGEEALACCYKLLGSTFGSVACTYLGFSVMEAVGPKGSPLNFIMYGTITNVFIVLRCSLHASANDIHSRTRTLRAEVHRYIHERLSLEDQEHFDAMNTGIDVRSYDYNPADVCPENNIDDKTLDNPYASIAINAAHAVVSLFF